MLADIWRSYLAALSMYTRLPAWRLANLQEQHYQAAINYLPLVGIFTGGSMTFVFWGAFYLLHLPILSAIILALTSRLLLTGAFHEDGLGDFFDGFGGGRSREDILRIMKDSHVGSYAVIGYILYYAFQLSLLTALPTELLPYILLCIDIIGKNLSLLQVISLPYARKQEDSKTKLIYNRKGGFGFITIPIVAVIMFNLASMWLILIPIATTILLICYIKSRIGGYTGDTCGAITLLGELSCTLAFSLYLLR